MKKKISKENYGQWALITGSSSGVGKEMAYEIAAKGLDVILIARRENLLTSLAEEIEKTYNVKSKVIAIDLASKNAIKDIITQTEGLEVGLVVHSAGYALEDEFSLNSMQDEADLLQVNLTVPTLLSHHFSQQMKVRKKGGIVFISSIMALAGAAGWASYNASKSHNLVLAEGLGEELRTYGIHVIALTPGSIASGFGERSHTKAMMGALKPKRVAKCGLWMLGCKRTHTAGLLNKIIALSTRITPRWLNTKIFSFVVKQLKKDA